MKNSSLGFIVLLQCGIAMGAFLFSSCTQPGPDTRIGENIYRAQCGSCHGQNGTGFRELYPPLGNSAYLGSHVRDLPCLIRTGVTGSIVTSDGSLNQRMPAFPSLTVRDSVELITYLQVRWGNSLNPVSPESVERWLVSCP